MRKLVIMTHLGEQILHTSIFKGCEILVECVILNANLILLYMYDSDVILGMDWLSNHRALMDCFTKNIVFKKLGYLDLEFEGDKKIIPTCVISTLKVKRFLHNGCEAYLAHVVDKSTPKVALDSVLVVREFPYVFSKDLPSLPLDRELEFGI